MLGKFQVFNRLSTDIKRGRLEDCVQKKLKHDIFYEQDIFKFLQKSEVIYEHHESYS